MNIKIKITDLTFGEINFLDGSDLSVESNGVLLSMDDAIKILNIKKSKCMIFIKKEDVFLYDGEKYATRKGLNKLYNLADVDYVDEFKNSVIKHMQSIISKKDNLIETVQAIQPVQSTKTVCNKKKNVQVDETFKGLISSVKNKMIYVNYHGFTTNRMYEYCTNTGIRKRTQAYNKWRENFPVKRLDKMKDKVDFSKPILAIYSFKCKENFDTPNFSKALNDMVCSYFGASDHFIRHEIIHTDSFVDKYENGIIGIYLTNID